MISDAQFRRDYPEFASVVTYPPSGVAYWLNLAGELLNANRWGASAVAVWPTAAPFPALKYYDVACELFVAHNITLEARAQKEAANGGIPGTMQGPLSSKTVDKVSASYDTAAAAEKDGGNWNLTIYGSRFLRMARRVGMGPLVVGLPGCAPAYSGADAWTGPPASISGIY